MSDFWDTKIEFLKGVGAQRASLLNKELEIFYYRDLIEYYPFRHEDRTRIYAIAELEAEMPMVQVRGQITTWETTGEGAKKRLVARFSDGSGTMDLLWFQGIQWQLKNLAWGIDYLVFGKPQFFNGKFSIVHPEIEALTSVEAQTGFLQPVYNLTELMKIKFVGSKIIAKMIKTLLEIAQPHFTENLPAYILQKHKLIERAQAVQNIHFPASPALLKAAKDRLKFEELFFLQLRILKKQRNQKKDYQGQIFGKSDLLTTFYNEHLPFELTGAQKRVVKEVFKDMTTGKQMNRLIQGDVGSGKTMVAFLAMLIAISNGAQVCMVAPTEILAEQHFEGLKVFADKMGLTIDLLTGSTTARNRRIMHERLMNGNLKILIGTHAIFEDKVQFENLGLCVIDEQHRFGVAQRSKLWQKNTIPPHILVMTATPIPRTLAMTVYGDLDVSVIDEMPAGRKPIITAHRYESHRLRVFGFIAEEVKKGRQVYMVYPLIEESEKLDYKNLMEGYESVSRAFPDFHLSIVHGQMSSVDKDYEMQRFKKGETHIMVATTVIEVGVNVPNASVMVIENAERFGLSQLHQLRGRVGRGAEQSYCILMTDYKLSQDSRVRLDTMVKTNNGFEIAEIDLKLRGPGDLMGTQQSGVLDLLLADLVKDGDLLQLARETAGEVLDQDTNLELDINAPIREWITTHQKNENFWSRIS